MKLTKGQILTPRGAGHLATVLDEICEDVYSIKVENSMDMLQLRTFKEIENYYIIPEVEKEWKDGERYYWIGQSGNVVSSTWADDLTDNGHKNFLGIYETEQEAIQARNKIKKLIKGI